VTPDGPGTSFSQSQNSKLEYFGSDFGCPRGLDKSWILVTPFLYCQHFFGKGAVAGGNYSEIPNGSIRRIYELEK
jgi:hypothetical protein